MTEQIAGEAAYFQSVYVDDEDGCEELKLYQYAIYDEAVDLIHVVNGWSDNSARMAMREVLLSIDEQYHGWGRSIFSTDKAERDVYINMLDRPQDIDIGELNEALNCFQIYEYKPLPLDLIR